MFAAAYERGETIRDVGEGTVFTPMTCARAERVSPDTLYEIGELSQLPRAEVTGTVDKAENAADGVYLSQMSPSCLFVDAATRLIDKNGEEITAEEIAAGDVVTTVFTRLFAGYAPEQVRVNLVKRESAGQKTGGTPSSLSALSA